MANILYLMDSEHATTWYRTRMPAEEFKKHGHSTMVDNKFNQEMLDWCDVLVIQRTNQEQIKEAVRYVNSRNKLTVLDLDDDYWNMHVTNPAWKSWQEPGVLFDFSNIIRECKRTTTTVEPLAKLLKQFSNDVRIIPNSLPDSYWTEVPIIERKNNNIVVGWAGSTSHYYDMQEVIPLFGQILIKYPNVEIQVAGVGPHWFPPLQRLIIVEPAKIEEYPSLLTRFDIGLAPLRDIKFNESKSNLKYLEYSAVKLPTVASKTITYSPHIKQGENGYLAKNTKDWLRYIKLLIEDKDLRQEIGNNAYNATKNMRMSRIIYQWAAAYDIQLD